MISCSPTLDVFLDLCQSSSNSLGKCGFRMDPDDSVRGLLMTFSSFDRVDFVNVETREQAMGEASMKEVWVGCGGGLSKIDSRWRRSFFKVLRLSYRYRWCKEWLG